MTAVQAIADPAALAPDQRRRELTSTTTAPGPVIRCSVAFTVDLPLPYPLFWAASRQTVRTGFSPGSRRNIRRGRHLQVFISSLQQRQAWILRALGSSWIRRFLAPHERRQADRGNELASSQLG